MNDTPLTTGMTAQEFRLMRGHLGLTVTWVADQLGISHVAVTHWEAGRVALPGYATLAMVRWLQDARVYSEWIVLANANSPLVNPARSTDSRLLAIPADLLTWQTTAPAALRHYPLAWAHRVAARAIEHRWVHDTGDQQTTVPATTGLPCDADVP